MPSKTRSVPQVLLRYIRYFVLLYAIAILLLHTLPFGWLVDANGSPNQFELGGLRPTHIFHVLMFLPWGIVAAFHVHRRPDGRVRRGIGWVLCGMIFAAGAEGIQYWLPYRSFTSTDLFCNLAGVALGSLAILIPRSPSGARRIADRVKGEGADDELDDRARSAL